MKKVYPDGRVAVFSIRPDKESKQPRRFVSVATVHNGSKTDKMEDERTVKALELVLMMKTGEE